MKNNKYQINVRHLTLRSINFLLLGLRISKKFYFLNLIICVLLGICFQMYLSMIFLFIFMHLILWRFSIAEPTFLKIDAKSFVKIPPILNRW